MRLTYISEGSKTLGMGHIMHQSVVMERLKWRVVDSKRDIVIVDHLAPEGDGPIDDAPINPYNYDGRKIVAFNCLEAPRWADVVVMPDVSPGFENSVTREREQVIFRGPKYWFLRDEFLRKDSVRYPLFKAGVMIGGTDPLGIADALKTQLRPDDNWVIVKGQNIASQMELCGLMLTGCGQSFWESLAVGTPAIPFASNEAQAKQYGSVFKLGNVEDIRGMIERQEWVEPDPKWEIGQGWQDVIEEILR